MANEEFQARRRRVRWFWAAAVGVLLLVVGWGLWPRPVEVDVVTVDRGDVRVDLVDQGRTRMHDTYVVSAPISGRVLRIEVEPGDTVGAGSIVARMTRAAAGFLDARTDLQARATVDAAAAQLRAAQTELDLAAREDTRIRGLAEQRLVSASAADASQARLKAAQAARDAAEAELQRARGAVQPADRTTEGSVTVRSPVKGRVLSIPQKSENVVAAGSPLLLIGDPSHIEVVAEFLSQDAVRMHPGQRAFIENWGGAPLAANVERVEPVAHLKVSALGVEEQRTNVILKFADQQAAQAFGHDFRVDARVAVEEAPNALRVPLGALFRHGDGWAAYKVVAGRVVLAPVKTGIADENYRVVESGLEAGDVLVQFPEPRIGDGVRVTPRGNQSESKRP
jgi:HlyD family secretion protein